MQIDKEGSRIVPSLGGYICWANSGCFSLNQTLHLSGEGPYSQYSGGNVQTDSNRRGNNITRWVRMINNISQLFEVVVLIK